MAATLVNTIDVYKHTTEYWEAMMKKSTTDIEKAEKEKEKKIVES